MSICQLVIKGFRKEKGIRVYHSLTLEPPFSEEPAIYFRLLTGERTNLAALESPKKYLVEVPGNSVFLKADVEDAIVDILGKCVETAQLTGQEVRVLGANYFERFGDIADTFPIPLYSLPSRILITRGEIEELPVSPYLKSRVEEFSRKA